MQLFIDVGFFCHNLFKNKTCFLDTTVLVIRQSDNNNIMASKLIHYFRNHQFLNISNSKTNGFLDAVCAKLFLPDTRINRKSSKLRFSEVQTYFSNLIYSQSDKNIKLGAIEKFCGQNKINIVLMRLEPNLSGRYDIYNFKTFTGNDSGDFINLVCIKNPDNTSFVPDDKSDFYFCLIKNIDKILDQHGIRKRGSRGHLCTNCLSAAFRSLDNLHKHLQDCLSNRSSNLIFPVKCEYGEEPIFQRLNLRNKQKSSIIGFLDFECKLIDVKTDIDQQCQQCYENDCLCSQKKTLLINKHEVISYAIIFVTEDMKVIRQKVYSGLKPIQHLVKYLQNSEEWLWRKINKYKNCDPLGNSRKNKRHYMNSSTCFFCNKPFPR